MVEESKKIGKISLILHKSCKTKQVEKVEKKETCRVLLPYDYVMMDYLQH